MSMWVHPPIEPGELRKAEDETLVSCLSLGAVAVADMYRQKSCNGTLIHYNPPWLP